MDGMAMVTTLKSNAARNTAASTTASAYQRRELMDMACLFAGSVPVGATLLTLDLHLCHCRLPRTSARPSARSATPQPNKAGPPASERAARRPLTGATHLAPAAGMPRAKGKRHENCDHGEPARNHVLPLPPCPGGLVVPGLERAATAGADEIGRASCRERV